MDFKQKKVNVDGVEYTLQKLPVRNALRLRDEWHVKGVLNQEKMYDLLISNVIVNPKVRLDDFDDISVVEELGAHCLNLIFLNGESSKN